MKKFRTNKLNRNLSSGVVYGKPRAVLKQGTIYIYIYMYIYIYIESRIWNRLGL